MSSKPLGENEMTIVGYNIIENPDRKYYDQMLEEIVRTDRWSRLTGEYDIWTESKEQFCFWIAFETNANLPVGIITLTLDKSLSHDPSDDLYSLGTFFIKKAHRRKGVGKILMTKCLEKTGKNNVTLNAALVTEEYFRTRYSFTHSPSYLHSVAIVKFSDFLTERQVAECTVKRAEEVDFEKIYEYDKKICSLDRGQYLKRWLLDGESVTRVALDSSGAVIGIACLRPQIADRVTVGPLYAETKNITRDLLISCLLNYSPRSLNTELWIRYPDPNEESIKRVLNPITNGNYETKVHGKSMFTQKVLESTRLSSVYGVMESAHSFT